MHTHQIKEQQNFEREDWFEFLTFKTNNLILHPASGDWKDWLEFKIVLRY